jgi:hypothetical protein
MEFDKNTYVGFKKVHIVSDRKVGFVQKYGIIARPIKTFRKNIVLSIVK